MSEKVLTPEEAWNAVKVLWPYAENIQRRVGKGWGLGDGGCDRALVEWPDNVEVWPPPSSPKTRPYTFKELAIEIAEGHDETNFGYITSINHSYVSFKRNDISETRALSDTSDVTWVDGRPFGAIDK